MNDDVTDYLDEQLQKARCGERAALTLLVQTHQRSVYSLALRMLGTRDLAEDLTQEVFMQMNGNLSTIDSNRHLGFWLRQVTTNRAIDQLRRRARVPMTSLDEETQLFSTDDTSDPLLQRHLQVLLAELSAPARAVLLLRYQEDLDPVEIARTLDMPLNTVKSHLKRSLESMREKTIGVRPVRCEDRSYE
ncbi:MAG: sigma-70 family RNA polymerase sigma factor [Steroidobacteraceae bacterium]